jgi:glycerophosphoryl diester phosphodiesterase
VNEPGPAWGRRDGVPLVIAHRGASALAVENTLAAFAAAAAAGADGVELDVRLCATGEVVVFHDADLRRLAGRADRIRCRRSTTSFAPCRRTCWSTWRSRRSGRSVTGA